MSEEAVNEVRNDEEKAAENAERRAHEADGKRLTVDLMFAKRFVEFLRRLHKADPVACKALLTNRVPVNDAVKNDPGLDVYDRDGASLMTVLNGFLHPDVKIGVGIAPSDRPGCWDLRGIFVWSIWYTDTNLLSAPPETAGDQSAAPAGLGEEVAGETQG